MKISTAASTGLLTLLALGFGLPAFANPAPTKPAENLAAVWTLTAQPCNGGGGNAMERHPDEAAVKASKTLTLADLGYEFTVPQLPNFEKTYVKLFLGDTSRGVVDHYLLLSDQDLEPPLAAIVITELPEPMQNAQEAFKAVHVLQTQLAASEGITLQLEPIDGPHGKALEMLVENRGSTYCYPTSDFALMPEDVDATTMGISRFTMIDGRLVEFSLIILIPDDATGSEAKQIAREVMDSFWLSLRSS